MPPADPDDRIQRQREQVGRRIRDQREQRGWSQEKLAEESGTSRFTVYRTELATHAASIDALAKIAQALGVPLRDLMPDDPQARDQS